MFYKKCLVQCSQLSTGQALLDLSNVFGYYLREYSNKILLNKLPGNKSSLNSIFLLTSINERYSGKTSQLSSTFSQVTAMLKDDAGNKLSRQEMGLTCLLLNSADYCLDTVSALEQKLLEKADPEFKDRIGFCLTGLTGFFIFCLDLSSERDLFGTVITNAIALLVQDMEYSCHAALQAMSKTNWSSVDTVSGMITLRNVVL